MAAASGLRGFWRYVRQLPGRTSLRVQLITVLLALVAVALVVISIASASVLSSYLQGRADSQVTAEYNYIVGQLVHQPDSRMPVAGGFSPISGFPYITEIRNDRGLVLHTFGFEQPSPSEPAVPTDPAWLRANSGRLVTIPSFSGTGNWRVITRQVPYQIANPATGTITTRTGSLIVGADIGDINGTIHRLANIDIVVSAIVLLGLAIVGVMVVRASLRPLTDIERTAVAIAAGDLSRRVPERETRTEVGSLGRSLNSMLAQIETAFHARAESEASAYRSEARMRQFVADASHELRTPLTAIRGFADYYRQRGGVMDGSPPNGSRTLDAGEVDQMISRIREQSSRMSVLVEDLLLLARLDQERPLEESTVDMLVLAADAVQDARIIAPARKIELTIVSGMAFLVRGDEFRLRQVIGNLMANALSHTPEATPVQVRLLSDAFDAKNAAVSPNASQGLPLPGPTVVLEVADQGPGLAPGQADRIFDRFYRTDDARARHTGGTGLGLAIVAALVAAHGGTVSADSEPARGSTFRIVLPLAPEARFTE